MLTPEEIKLVNSGFGHMVDPGYGKISTAEDVLRVLEVRLLRGKREVAISRLTGFAAAEIDPIAERLAIDEQFLNYLKKRVAA